MNFLGTNQLYFFFGLAYLLCTLFLHESMQAWAASGNPEITKIISIFTCLVIVYLLVIKFRTQLSKSSELNGLIIFALLAKFVFLFTPILLTGDWPRYLFEGLLLRNGLNPYEVSPESFQGLRPEYWNLIEYKHLPAIYPPFAQFLFSAFANDIFTWKVFLFCIEIINLALLLKILDHKKLAAGNVFIYLLSPLALIEISLSAHLDALLVTVFLAFYYVYQNKDSYLSLTLMALITSFGIAIKYIPIVLLGILLIKLFTQRKIKEALFSLLATIIFTVIFFIPFLDNNLLYSLSQYLSHWRFNDFLFELVGNLLSVNWEDSRSFENIKLVFLIVWAGLAIFISFLKIDFAEKAAYIFASYLLLSPVFHPWYALWFLPFLCFIKSKALFYLSLSILLSHQVKLYGLDQPSLIVKLVEFLPVYLMIFFKLLSKSSYFQKLDNK